MDAVRYGTVPFFTVSYNCAKLTSNWKQRKETLWYFEKSTKSCILRVGPFSVLVKNNKIKIKLNNYFVPFFLSLFIFTLFITKKNKKIFLLWRYWDTFINCDLGWDGGLCMWTWTWDRAASRFLALWVSSFGSMLCWIIVVDPEWFLTNSAFQIILDLSQIQPEIYVQSKNGTYLQIT